MKALPPGPWPELIAPVAVRAIADQLHQKSLRFRDRAAKQVLRRLGIPITQEDSRRSVADSQVELCQWIDTCVDQFFRTNPRGRGIEVGGGLSTRFHRISENNGWPRFSWINIESKQNADCFEKVFPVMDNHELIALENLNRDWLDAILGLEKSQNFIVFGEFSPIQSRKSARNLVEKIKSELKGRSAPCDMILCYRSIPWIEVLFPWLPPGISIASRFFSADSTIERSRKLTFGICGNICARHLHLTHEFFESTGSQTTL